jgi:hypothetical protein
MTRLRWSNAYFLNNLMSSRTLLLPNGFIIVINPLFCSSSGLVSCLHFCYYFISNTHIAFIIVFLGFHRVVPFLRDFETS